MAASPSVSALICVNIIMGYFSVFTKPPPISNPCSDFVYWRTSLRFSATSFYWKRFVLNYENYCVHKKVLYKKFWTEGGGSRSHDWRRSAILFQKFHNIRVSVTDSISCDIYQKLTSAWHETIGDKKVSTIG